MKAVPVLGETEVDIAFHAADPATTCTLLQFAAFWFTVHTVRPVSVSIIANILNGSNSNFGNFGSRWPLTFIRQPRSANRQFSGMCADIRAWPTSLRKDSKSKTWRFGVPCSTSKSRYSSQAFCQCKVQKVENHTDWPFSSFCVDSIEGNSEV